MKNPLISSASSRKKPKLSVCVITYNHEKYIRQCLQSLVDQQVCFDYDIVVGDDASTDGTRKIISEFEDRYPGKVRAFLHDENVGPCQNYRDVHFQARGEYIAHIDGDDYWMPWKLQQQSDFLDSHHECVAVYGNAVVISDDQSLLGAFNDRIPEVFDLDFLLARGNFLNNSSLCYRTIHRERVLPDGDFLDYLVHLRLGCIGKLGYLNKALVVYRAGSATSVLLNLSNVCRELSWEALHAAQLMPVSKDAERSAMSLFFFDVLHEGVRRFDIPFMLHWTQRIYADSGGMGSSAMLAGLFRAVLFLVMAPTRRMRRFFFGSPSFRVFHGR
ncbi:glycosyltransferase [Chlorobium sp. N1]|uniref:glycosyltransferase family 2 protein n=1 Tax=Chlorobium sp. N1 TaxID=2491138 RepID=UPI001040D2A9|nr:glycosyltransferase [Chlorobium sp. N1]TCD47278.1 glycosyltransferase [Chlorobium sp. N1]